MKNKTVLLIISTIVIGIGIGAAYYFVDNTTDAEFQAKQREQVAKWANCPPQKEGDSDLVVLSFSTSADAHTDTGWYVRCTRIAARKYIIEQSKKKRTKKKP